MSIYWATILGAVQGITEILPISSSAHLVLFPWFFSAQDQGLAFDVALHLGSLLAVIIAFSAEWLKLLKEGIKLIENKLKPENHSQKMIYYLIIATIPGALAGYFLEEVAETTFRSPYIIVFTLVFYGLLLYYFEKKGSKAKSFSDITLKDALTIGVAQALAIVPGTSRSGVTISAGLFSGLKKEEAAKFSFMLSAPIILGAGLVKIPDIPVSELTAPYFWVGLASSLIFALISIRFILRFVKERSYGWFTAYRIALALVILTVLLVRG
ncbi:MAG: undecaprenyl-diphosphate phosphatase [Patescibacteria group bacterium]|nr:undecaprenyl-diphosphate phosphatase [Patescibacteria group bacterium]